MAGKEEFVEAILSLATPDGKPDPETLKKALWVISAPLFDAVDALKRIAAAEEANYEAHVAAIKSAESHRKNVLASAVMLSKEATEQAEAKPAFGGDGDAANAAVEEERSAEAAHDDNVAQAAAPEVPA